jgi:hypothetical protein
MLRFRKTCCIQHFSASQPKGYPHRKQNQTIKYDDWECFSLNFASRKTALSTKLFFQWVTLKYSKKWLCAPWRRMGECKYSSTNCWPRRYVEVDGLLYVPVTLLGSRWIWSWVGSNAGLHILKKHSLLPTGNGTTVPVYILSSLQSSMWCLTVWWTRDDRLKINAV